MKRIIAGLCAIVALGVVSIAPASASRPEKASAHPSEAMTFAFTLTDLNTGKTMSLGNHPERAERAARAMAGGACWPGYEAHVWLLRGAGYIGGVEQVAVSRTFNWTDNCVWVTKGTSSYAHGEVGGYTWCGVVEQDPGYWTAAGQAQYGFQGFFYGKWRNGSQTCTAPAIQAQVRVDFTVDRTDWGTWTVRSFANGNVNPNGVYTFNQSGSGLV